MNAPKKSDTRLEKYNEERVKLLAKLSDVGFVWHGSIRRSLLTCGTPSCRCHTDPAARHGPYVYWTTKVAGRTVSRLLPPGEAELYEEWIENRRRIERVVRDLKALSAKAARLLLKQRASPDAPNRRRRP